MATIDVWRPPSGTQDVSVGPVLQAALDAFENGTTHSGASTEYYSFRYRFRPESVDASQPGRITSIESKSDGTASFRMDQPSITGEDRYAFAGVQSAAKDFECVLIYDEVTGEFTLEKVESLVELKYDRAASVNGNGNGRIPSPPDDPPTPGATVSSKSPPTPPQTAFYETGVSVVQPTDLNLELDIDIEQPSPRPIKVKPRQKVPGKTAIGIVAPTKTTGKRPRDDGGKKEPPVRETKRQATPPRPPPRPMPLSLPPARAPTPPARQRTPDDFMPDPGSQFTFDDDHESHLPAPIRQVLEDELTIDEQPKPLSPTRQPFSEGFIEGEADDQDIEKAFDFSDEEEEAGGEDEDEDGGLGGNGGAGPSAGGHGEGEDEDEEDDEDDDEDEFSQALEALEEVQQAPPPTKVPISLNTFAESAFAGGGDDDESEEESAGDSGEDD